MQTFTWQASIEHLLCVRLHAKHFPWHSLLSTYSAFQGKYYHVQLTHKKAKAQLSEGTSGELESISSYLTLCGSVC